MNNNTTIRPALAAIKSPEAGLLYATGEKKKANPSYRLYVVARNGFVAKRYSFDDNGGGYRGL